MQLNKINPGNLICSNMDGRAFVEKLRKEGKTFSHVLMNLPATGIEFLDVFVSECMSDWPAEVDLPIMHTYCFSKSSKRRKTLLRE